MTGARIAYTLSVVIDGQRLFLAPDQSFTLPNVIGCGTYGTFPDAMAAVRQTRQTPAFKYNTTFEVVKVNT